MKEYMMYMADSTTPKRCFDLSNRGYDKPRLIWLAIAIDPVQVVYIYQHPPMDGV